MPMWAFDQYIVTAEGARAFRNFPEGLQGSCSRAEETPPELDDECIPELGASTLPFVMQAGYLTSVRFRESCALDGPIEP